MNIVKLAMNSLMGLATLLSSAAFADSVQFDLGLSGVIGNQTVDGVTDLIPIDSFSFFDPQLSVTRTSDSLSPLLEKAAVTGEHFSSATIYVFETVAGSISERSYTFSNVTAASFALATPEEVEGFAYTGSPVISSVPEPATVWLMLLGLGGVGVAARRRTASF